MVEVEINKMYERIKDGRYYKAMIDHSPVAIMIVDPSGSYLDANEAASKFLGYSVQELREMRFQQLTHGDDLIATMEMTNAMLKGESDKFELIKRYLTKKGIAWAALRVNAVRDDNGSLEVYVVHVIPLHGFSDDVMREIIARMTSKSDKIEIHKFTLVGIVLAASLVESLICWLFN